MSYSDACYAIGYAEGFAKGFVESICKWWIEDFAQSGKVVDESDILKILKNFTVEDFLRIFDYSLCEEHIAMLKNSDYFKD